MKQKEFEKEVNKIVTDFIKNANIKIYNDVPDGFFVTPKETEDGQPK
jgi:hypothetical protein